MENASKALIIAGGVLIGVLILSLWVYLFTTFGITASEINVQADQTKITQFNSQFTAYEGKEGLTIYDVITVFGYAKENNNYYEDNSDYKVTVSLDTKRDIQNYDEGKKIDLINADQAKINANNSLPTYNCKITKYHSNGRVEEIKFTTNKY